MTIVICDIHDNHPGINTCEHILSDDNSSSTKNAKKVVFTIDGNPEFESYLCESCIASANIGANEELELGELKAEKAYGLASSISCKYCLEEALRGA